MEAPAHLRRILLATMTIAVVASVAFTTAFAMQQPAAAPRAMDAHTIRDIAPVCTAAGPSK